jgi:hypothetical protein
MRELCLARDLQNGPIRYIHVKAGSAMAWANASRRKESWPTSTTCRLPVRRPAPPCDTTLAFVHTNSLPQTRRHGDYFRAPRHARIRPQAYVVPTLDPDEANVTVWVTGLTSTTTGAGQKVVRVRVALSGRDPKRQVATASRRSRFLTRLGATVRCGHEASTHDGGAAATWPPSPTPICSTTDVVAHRPRRRRHKRAQDCR